MKKYLLSLLIAWVASCPALSETKQNIIASEKYYYGEGTAGEDIEARDRALKQLSEQIAVNVQSFSERDLIEKNGDMKDAYRNLIHTYSQSTLRNVQTIRSKTNDGFEVFCYIAKAEVGKIFDERKQLVKNIYEKGLVFEQEGNITDALKYYYFAVILMNSVPEKTVVCDGKNLVVEIPARINAVVNSAKYVVIADRHTGNSIREIEVRVDIAGKPTRQADISFLDGSQTVNVHAIDGVATFRLFGASVAFKELNIELRYKFYESREEIAEVLELWNLVVKPSFKNVRTVALRVGAPGGVGSEKIIIDRSSAPLTLANPDNSPVAAIIESETKKLISLLSQNTAAGIQGAYGADKFLADKILGLMRYNKLQVTLGTADAMIHRTATGWEVRQIPVICHYETVQRQTTEYLILDFTNAGTIEDVNFGTMKSLYSEFVEHSEKGADWDSRQVIIKFMERYRTAFMTRNMPMLDSLFSDEAVIIIGREIKKGKKRDDVQYSKLNSSQPDFNYTQYTKAEYLKNQRKAFQLQTDIVIGFSSFKILKKNNVAGTYSISMKQNYTSTTYADEGHLFLLVDFKQVKPQIYIRAWQPQEWNEDAIIQSGNYKMNK